MGKKHQDECAARREAEANWNGIERKPGADPSSELYVAEAKALPVSEPGIAPSHEQKDNDGPGRARERLSGREAGSERIERRRGHEAAEDRAGGHGVGQ